MESCLAMTIKIDKETAKGIRDSIVDVLECGARNKLEQHTIIEALITLRTMSRIEHATVSHCQFVGEKNVTVEAEFANDKKEDLKQPHDAMDT